MKKKERRANKGEKKTHAIYVLYKNSCNLCLYEISLNCVPFYLFLLNLSENLNWLKNICVTIHEKRKKEEKKE